LSIHSVESQLLFFLAKFKNKKFQNEGFQLPEMYFFLQEMRKKGGNKKRVVSVRGGS
jgi:hypothetical protein